LPFDDAPTPDVEDEPIANIRTLLRVCKAATT
jgi:hypothetical protein